MAYSPSEGYSIRYRNMQCLLFRGYVKELPLSMEGICQWSIRGYGNVPVKSKLKHPPRAYPGHLTSFTAREGGNDELGLPGAGHLITTQVVGNLTARLDFMLRVALMPRGVISHAEDKPSCIQSERYPIRGGLADKERLAQALLCI